MPAWLTAIGSGISLKKKKNLRHPKERGSFNGIRNWKWILWILFNIWVDIQGATYFLHHVLIKPESLFSGVKKTIPVLVLF